MPINCLIFIERNRKFKKQFVFDYATKTAWAVRSCTSIVKQRQARCWPVEGQAANGLDRQTWIDIELRLACFYIFLFNQGLELENYYR